MMIKQFVYQFKLNLYYSQMIHLSMDLIHLTVYGLKKIHLCRQEQQKFCYCLVSQNVIIVIIL